MFRVKRGVWTVGIPMWLCLLAVLWKSVVLMCVAVLSHFVLLAVVPAFRRNENIWMFVMTAFSFIPMNISIFVLLANMDVIFCSFWWMEILRCVMYYVLLFSVEEVVMGVVTSCVWRKQKTLYSLMQ